MKNLYRIMFSIGLVLLAVQGYSQESQPAFRPWVYWERNMDFGAVLSGPKELQIVDSLGTKRGRVVSSENIIGAYVSPNGKKVGYVTATEVWVVQIETGQKELVASGYCEHFNWAGNSQSFTFALSEYKKDSSPAVYNLKLFWADGDGKNLKQVYP
ncbi:MAG: hypothetical protein A2X31_10230 [Elusimicrobia bacterium GWB2_63_22]|nr:MAG: hypothetical protein A2X31_10230 [Elusimicrobia bacterium GWB2_63_22]